MKRIVYTRPDGGVSVVVPAPKAKHADETEAEFLARISAAIPQGASDITVCDEAEIPSDRTYRDAWERGSAALVTVSMTKAKEIQRGRLRDARPAKFVDLDGKWMQAVAAGNDTEAARIEAERQVLRDLPQDPAIAAAKTPDELKTTWPEGL